MNMILLIVYIERNYENNVLAFDLNNISFLKQWAWSCIYQCNQSKSHTHCLCNGLELQNIVFS